MTIEIPLNIEDSLKQVVSEVVKPLFKEIERLKDEVVALRENSNNLNDMELLDKEEVSKILGVTTKTIDEYRKLGKFPEADLYLGRHPKWRKKTLEKFLKEQR